MSSLQNLHNEYNPFPEYTNYHITYQFDKKTKEWKFHGYRCVKCDGSFKTRQVLSAHYNRCPQIKTGPRHRKDNLTEETKIIDKNGKEWRPLEMIQKKPE